MLDYPKMILPMFQLHYKIILNLKNNALTPVLNQDASLQQKKGFRVGRVGRFLKPRISDAAVDLGCGA